MSAKLCGCDLEQDYVCEQHRGTAQDADIIEMRAPATYVSNQEAWERSNREAWQRTISIGAEMARQVVATPIEESFIDMKRILAMLVDELQALERRVDASQTKDSTRELTQRVIAMHNEREHMKDVLSTFYRAPVSLSSLQPVMDLAVELNPSLKVRI